MFLAFLFYKFLDFPVKIFPKALKKSLAAAHIHAMLLYNSAVLHGEEWNGYAKDH